MLNSAYKNILVISFLVASLIGGKIKYQEKTRTFHKLLTIFFKSSCIENKRPCAQINFTNISGERLLVCIYSDICMNQTIKVTNLYGERLLVCIYSETCLNQTIKVTNLCGDRHYWYVYIVKPV